MAEWGKGRPITDAEYEFISASLDREKTQVELLRASADGTAVPAWNMLEKSARYASRRYRVALERLQQERSHTDG